MVRRGFTLIELLIVMGIITLLISILLPAVNLIWEAANATKCKSNLKTLSNAFMAFAQDHDQHLPGSRMSYWADQNPDHWDWLFGRFSTMEWYVDPKSPNPPPNNNYSATTKAQQAPQFGTIFKYIAPGWTPPPAVPLPGVNYADPPAAALAVYRCPSLVQDKPGSGVGSNGRFDYFAYCCWSGADLRSIKATSSLHFPLDPKNPTLVADATWPYVSYGLSTKHEDFWPTPLIAQEDARIWSNTNIDTWGEYCREMAHVHYGGCYYAAIDGQVLWINEPDTDPTNTYNMGARLWFQNGPRTGQPRALDFDPGAYTDGTIQGNPIGWGYWSHM